MGSSGEEMQSKTNSSGISREASTIQSSTVKKTRNEKTKSIDYETLAAQLGGYSKEKKFGDNAKGIYIPVGR
jgi:hypothetical protein